MAVMAELLWRGWNVAVPEVDVGEDVFVVQDETGDLWRVQVKTATAKPQDGGYSAQFHVDADQLKSPRTPDLVYVFAVRGASGWEPFTLIERGVLHREHRMFGVGSVSRDGIVFRFVSRETVLECSGRDFSAFRNDWSRWPLIVHGPRPVAPAPPPVPDKAG
jgi:hypothetical protein